MSPPIIGPIIGKLREEGVQFVVLTRHFFERMFRNDTVDFEDQMKERLIVVLVALAIILLWSSNTLLFKYQFVPDNNRSWQEKNYIFTLMMILFGIVTVLEWDVLFPDRRDYLNLTSLPVRMRTVFLSKMASFVAFVGLFSLAMTSLSSLVFAMFLTDWRAKSVVVAARYVVSHVVAGFAANFVVFFSFVFLQVFLLAFLPEKISRRVSLLVRFALVAGLVFVLLGFLVMPGILDSSFLSLEALKANNDPFVYRFPPLWFVGLYEVILGTGDPVFIAQARIALAAVAVSILSFALGSFLSYRRHLRKTLDLDRGSRLFRRAREVWSGALHAAFRMPGEERAVHGFFRATLGGSAKHRMTFAYFLAVGSSAALIFITAFASKGWLERITPANGFVLVIPVMIAFIIVVGIRSLVNVPVAVEANWIFQSTETSRWGRYVSGLKKAVFLRLAIPLSLAVFLVHSLVWDFRDSFLHAAFILGLCLLGVEAAFLRFRKIPFACAYLPGKSKLHLWGFPSAVAVVVSLTLAAKLEVWLFEEPRRYFFYFLGVVVSAGILEAVGRIKARPLVYEEEPEPALVGFPES